MAPNNDTLSVIERFESESPLATELRRLYYNARSCIEGASPRSFLITSSQRGEGKTTISSNLAVTVAQFRKKKVLVIDSDLRRPRQHDLFKLSNDAGFRDCLEQGTDPMRVVQETELPNLHVITAGKRSPAPGKLFESDALAEVIRKTSFYYDIVLVDSAPVLAVSDTQIMCPEMDCTLLVVLAGVTPREVVERSRNILIDSNARLGGVVLNNASSALPYYYDYKYYGYASRGE